MQTAFFRPLCLTLMVSFVLPILGQSIDFSQYQPAQSKGDVPLTLKKSTTSLVQENIRQIKKKRDDRRSKRQELEHSIRVSFVEEELLTGGQILYGEAMSEYVEKVGLKVLESYPDLSDKLQFYVLRSHVPNAYTTSGGLVFVSIGLLARIENEAQLAVILAHEIQHYIKKHALQSYKDIENAKKNTANDDLESKLSQLYRFSEDQELEADDLGYEMISKTDYDLQEGIYVFEMLKYSAYPFLETPITIDSFASPYYVFPEVLQERIRKEIEKSDVENKKADEKELVNPNRTHPHLDMRMLALRDRVAKLNADQSSKRAYIVGKALFDEMQKIARHELLLLFMRRADYGRTFYLSRIFEILYGPTPFVSRVKAMSVYALLNHKLVGNDLDKFGCDVNSNRGMWKPLTAGLKAMDAKELSAFVLRVLWLERDKYPQDSFVNKVWIESLRLVQQKALMDIKLWVDYQLPVNESTPLKVEEINDKLADKTENPLLSRPNRRAVNSETLKQSEAYYWASLYGLPNSDKLKNEILNATLDFNAMATNRETRNNALRDENREKMRYNFVNRDYKGLVLLQPKMMQYDGRNYSNNERNFFAEERSKMLITDIWKEVARGSRDNLHVLENKAKTNMKTDDLNQFTQVNDWIMERLNNDTNQMILFYSQYVNEVMQRYETPLVAWTGYDYVLYKRPLDLNGLMTSLMFPPYFAVYLYFQLQTDGFTKQYTVVFNTESSKQVFTYSQDRNVKWQRDFLKAHVYETLYEIRHTKNLK